MKVPITLNFDEENVIGTVELTKKGQEILEQHSNEDDGFILSPGYIVWQSDGKAELVGFGMIRGQQVSKKLMEQKGKKSEE